MNKRDADDFCKKWLPSWTGNNSVALIKFYSDDAYYRDPANTRGLRGHSQILPYFKKLLASNPYWKWEPVEVLPIDRGFVLKWKASIPVGSEIIVEEGLDIVEIKNDRITRNEVYFDRAKWLAASRQNQDIRSNSGSR
jgi:hypothetical protein